MDPASASPRTFARSVGFADIQPAKVRRASLAQDDRLTDRFDSFFNIPFKSPIAHHKHKNRTSRPLASNSCDLTNTSALSPAYMEAVASVISHKVEPICIANFHVTHLRF